MFNPQARAQVVKFDADHFCLVIDDALLEPEKHVQWAAARAADFQRAAGSAYPGVCLPAPADLVRATDELFRSQVRRLFDVRRSLSLLCRYSLVTLPPEVLQPFQRICHTDATNLDPRMSVQASVLYLFKDPGFGGTSFYVPNRPDSEMAALFQDAMSCTREQFTERHGIAQAYMNDGNRYFRKVGGIDAKWNRLIFYDGDILHSGDIPAPERLSADPLTGRLTLNGFFTSRRNLAR
jgi:hypothetical protein